MASTTTAEERGSASIMYVRAREAWFICRWRVINNISHQGKQRVTVMIKSLYSQYQSYAPFVTVLSAKTGESNNMINGGILKFVKHEVKVNQHISGIVQLYITQQEGAFSEGRCRAGFCVLSGRPGQQMSKVKNYIVPSCAWVTGADEESFISPTETLDVSVLKGWKAVLLFWLFFFVLRGQVRSPLMWRLSGIIVPNAEL